RARQQDHVLRVHAEAGPDFRAVDDVVIALPLGFRGHRAEIGAVVGFGEALAPDVLRAEDVLDEALLVLVRPHLEDQWPRPVETDRVEHEGPAWARHLLRSNILKTLRQATAAILLWPRHPEIACLMDLALPLAEEFELLVRAHFHEGLGQ